MAYHGGYLQREVPKACEVAGCGVRRDATYAGLPRCQAGWGGSPEYYHQVFKGCLYGSATALQGQPPKESA